MATQLAEYVATNGPEIRVNGRTFRVEGIGEDQDIKVATFATERTRLHGVVCLNAWVKSLPGAEVWSVVSHRGTVATFAVHKGALHTLR